MGWVRLDDHFDEHPKLAGVTDHALAVWTCGLAYCNRHVTDGFIPTNIALTLRPGRAKAAIKELVASRLWHPVDGGWRVHDYLEYQPSRETIASTTAAKKTAGQAGGIAAAKARARPNATAGATAGAQAKSKPNPGLTPGVNLNYAAAAAAPEHARADAAVRACSREALPVERTNGKSSSSSSSSLLISKDDEDDGHADSRGRQVAS